MASKYVKYNFTGRDKRNGSKSPIPPGIIWAHILALKALKLVLSVGPDHEEEYFVIKEGADYRSDKDYLLMYGDVEEISEMQFEQIKDSMAQL